MKKIFFFSLFLFFFPFISFAQEENYNLKLISIESNSSSPKAGNNITITVKAQNTGEANISSSLGILNYDYSFTDFEVSHIQTPTVDSARQIVSGDYFYYFIEGKFLNSGTKKLSFSLDDGNLLRETDENDNSLSVNLSVSEEDYYDLAVESIELEPSDVVTDEKIKIVIKVKNNGTLPLKTNNGITNFYYKFDNFVKQSIDYTNINFGDIEKGEYITYEIGGYFSKSGEANLQFIADQTDQLDEKNEDNNSKTISVNISSAQPEVRIESVDISPETIIYNQETQIDVTIVNAGNTIYYDSLGFLGEDIALKYSGFKITKREKSDYPSFDDPFDPGETFTFTYYGKFNKVGKNIFGFAFDISKKMADTDRTNNSTTTQIIVYKSQKDADYFEISNEKLYYLSSTSVMICWDTCRKTSGRINYREAKFNNFNQHTNFDSSAKNHCITLSSLIKNHNYVYEIEANYNTLTKYTLPQDFKTPENDSLIFKKNPVYSYEPSKNLATFTWQSNLRAKSVLYWKKAGEKEYLSKDAGSADNFSLNLENLELGTYEYYVELSANGKNLKSPLRKFVILNKENGSEQEEGVQENKKEQGASQVFDLKNIDMFKRLQGRIILKTQDSGKAYYIEPKTQKMYYLGRPNDAFSLMRNRGVGISNANLAKIPIGVSVLSGVDSDNDGLSDLFEDAIGTDKNSKDSDNDSYSDKQELLSAYNPLGEGKLAYDLNFTEKHLGTIFLQVESKGEAWYLNPVDKKRYFLGRPADAFSVMRNLSLGISNNDFNNL